MAIGRTFTWFSWFLRVITVFSRNSFCLTTFEKNVFFPKIFFHHLALLSVFSLFSVLTTAATSMSSTKCTHCIFQLLGVLFVNLASNCKFFSLNEPVYEGGGCESLSQGEQGCLAGCPPSSSPPPRPGSSSKALPCCRSSAR